MPHHRRKSLIGALARRLSVEAHRLSLLSMNLQALRKALDRLGRELVIWLAILVCLWHLAVDFIGRMLGR